MHTLSSRRGDISPSGALYDGFREGEWQLVEYRGVGLRATICRLLGGEAKNAGASECVSRWRLCSVRERYSWSLHGELEVQHTKTPLLATYPLAALHWTAAAHGGVVD